MKEEMKKLEEAFASVKEQFKTLKAYGDEKEKEGHEEMMDKMLYLLGNLSERISYLSSSYYDYTYNHSKGHLPAAKTRGQMLKALEMLGMSEEYEVGKSYISVANTGKGKILEASFKK